eukprot:s828_g3.t1
MMFLSLAAVVAIMCVFTCCPHTMREYPTNYFLLAMFTEAVMVGFVCANYTAQSVVMTSSLLPHCYLGSLWLQLHAHDRGNVWRSWKWILQDPPRYIVVDTQMIIGGKHSTYSFTVDDYCMAAITLYVESQRAQLQAQLDEVQAGYVSLKAVAEAERSKTCVAEQTLKERDARVAQLLEEIQKYRSQQNLMKDEAIELAEHRAWLGEDQRWLLTLESRLKEEQKRASELEDQLLEEKKRCARRLEDASQELLEEKAKCLELRKPRPADWDRQAKVPDTRRV